jgi:hypothetical protein
VVDGREATSLQLVGRFPQVVMVDFDEPAGSTAATDFSAELVGGVRLGLWTQWLDEGRLESRLEAGVPGGTYSVVVTDARGQTATLADALEVLTDGGLLPDGGSDCALTYEDGDGDGWGLDGTGGAGCGPGRAPRGQDCDDGDALTHPEALETCNRLDDDCDGQLDEGVCPPDAGWTVQPESGGPSDDWQTAWSYAPGAVWIAGHHHVWHRQAASPFEPQASSCPLEARASWASSDGAATVGFGVDRWGAVALATPLAPGCDERRWMGDQVVGVVGFELEPEGGAVTLAAASRHGRLWRFGPGERPVELTAERIPGVHLADLHGLGPEALVAVGSDERSGRPWAFFWVDGGWSGQALPGTGAAHGVWVAAPGSTFVVGDEGLVVESRDGGWVQLGELGGASLRAVRAFGSGRVYTVEREGRVRRWSRGRWEVLVELGPGAPLNDITGTSEEDLWVVGDHGLVLHWP